MRVLGSEPPHSAIFVSYLKDVVEFVTGRVKTREIVTAGTNLERSDAG
jgi:hypothetical protein